MSFFQSPRARLNPFVGRTLLLLLAGSTLLWGAPLAASPFQIFYAGRLTESSGKPVAGPVSVKLRLFSHPTSQTATVAVEIPAFSAVSLTDGVFQLPLDLSEADYQTAFDPDHDLWVEVTDEVNHRTYPRQRFSAVPYALKVPLDDVTLNYSATGRLQLKTSNPPAANKVLKVDGTGALTWGDDLTGGAGGTGDMLKATYDVNANDKVDAADNASLLNGQPAAFYQNATNLTGTVSDARLSSNVSLLGASIDSAEITNGTIAAVDIAPNSLTANEIATDAVDTAEIKNTAVIDSKIAGMDAAKLTGTINNSRLAATVSLLGTDINLASAEVVGTLPVANGGTGATSTGQSFAFIGPSGGAGAPGFRSLVASDYPTMGAASAGSPGAKGAVPQPAMGDQGKFLRGDGTWATSTGGSVSSLDGAGGTPTQALYVDNTGKVGIGMTNPAYKLDVAGSLNVAATISFIGGSLSNGLLLNNNGAFVRAITNTGEGGSVDALYNLNAPSSGTILGSHNLGNGSAITASMKGISTENHVFTSAYGSGIAFFTTPNGTVTPVEKIRINHDGNVGIGTTNPLAKMHVKAPSEDALSWGMGRFDTNTGTDDVGIKFGALAGSGSAGYSYIQSLRPGVSNDGNLLLNPINGNVGIATNAPTAKLQVKGQMVSMLPSTLTPAGTTQTIDFSTGNSQVLDLGSASGAPVVLTLSNAVAGGSYAVKIIQGATSRTVTWPGSVKWPGGTLLTLSTANGSVDLVTMFFDGTNFYANGGNNYQ